MSRTKSRGGIMVVKREGEDVESLIKRFKKKVNNSGILRELKNASAFLKPSQKKKRKRKEAAIRKEKEDSKIKKRGHRSYEKHPGDK
jgi:small subunit ribosomal protein S21